MDQSNSRLVWQSTPDTTHADLAPLLPVRSRTSFRPSQVQLMQEALQGNDMSLAERQVLSSVLSRITPTAA